jgi:hypothetical protein
LFGSERQLVSRIKLSNSVNQAITKHISMTMKRDKQLAYLLKKYHWLIAAYCFAAGGSRFANGGLGGTGANQGSMGMVKDCPPHHFD